LQISCLIKYLQNSGEQFVKSQREQEREDYARSLGVTLEDDTGVGRTIKNWAMGIFVFEVVCAVIYGFLMLFTGNVVGLLIVAAGVVLARGSYWVLYAFGELVEKTSANEQNTRNILKVLLDEKRE
jgi:hypothetical protein